MKTNAVLKISTNQIRSKSKNLPKKQDVSAFQNINQTVNDLWEMYQNQLQRNVELMKVIQHQQQYIQSFGGNHPQFIPQHQSPVQVIESVATEAAQPLVPAFKDLTMDQVNKYTDYFKLMFQNKVRRLDAIHKIIRLLHTLHHLGGSAYAEVLFEKAGLVNSTGTRHILFLQRQGLITWKDNLDYKHHLTKDGTLFLQGKLEKPIFISECYKKYIPTEPLIG